MHQLTGDYDAAAGTVAQAIELFRDLGSRHGLAMALNTGGELAARTSAAEEARRYHSEALAIARELGARPVEARALAGVGRSLLHRDPAEAAGYLRDALAIFRQVGFPGRAGGPGHAGRIRPVNVAGHLARRAASRR